MKWEVGKYLCEHVNGLSFRSGTGSSITAIRAQLVKEIHSLLPTHVRKLNPTSCLREMGLDRRIYEVPLKYASGRSDGPRGMPAWVPQVTNSTHIVNFRKRPATNNVFLQNTGEKQKWVHTDYTTYFLTLH